MIRAPYIDLPLRTARDVADALTARIPSYPVACANWAAYPYTPEVHVRVAHAPAHLLLHYRVREQSIRARCTQPNGEVWKDSCVEFFVSLDGKRTYYSFELSCIGTPLLAYYTAPHVGAPAPPEVVGAMLISSTLDRCAAAGGGGEAWQLRVAIPYTCFFAHRVASLSGEVVHANFYKCGDGLKVPHFLSMFPIGTPEPDFHCPQFFGELAFTTSNP